MFRPPGSRRLTVAAEQLSTAEAPQERPDAEEILRESGALIENDHFVYISGEHGSGWIDKDAVYPYTERTSALAELIAEQVAGLDSWPREQCPLCREGKPVNTAYAHGSDFVAAGGNWP